MADLNGTDGNDTLSGVDGHDAIYGNRGDDVIVGGSGKGIVHGGAGNDTLTGYGNGGTMFGGAGNDVLYSGQHPGAAQMHIYGGAGNDTFYLDQSDRTAKFGQHVWGGEGRDRFIFVNTTGEQKITGRIDDFDISRDEIWVDGAKLDFANLPSNVRVIAYQDQPWLLINGRALYTLEGARHGIRHGDHDLGRDDESHFIEWSEIFRDGVPASYDIPYEDYHDVLPAWAFGIPQNQLNVIRGTSGETGADSLVGTSGNDWIMGFNQSDTIHGGDGHDAIDGGEMMDVIHGGRGNDSIAGGLDDDWLSGDEGDDLIFGGSGHDTILGGAGRDELRGNNGDDLILGGDAEDSMYGGIGNDSLFGGSGDDIAKGDNGRDVIAGGDGDDTLAGGAGRDRMFGGEGADSFVFTADDLVEDGGSNVVMDFGAGDVIDLRDLDLTLVGDFGGRAGELTYEVIAGMLRLQADIDGDGRADLQIHVLGQDWDETDPEEAFLL